MVAKLTGALRAAPATVPGAAALALFVIWASDQAGYPLTHWAPGSLVIMGLLAIGIGVLGLRLGEMPRPAQIALACLAAYTAFSFLSILWAAVPGEAWEGADRTLLYLLVFALFAGWAQRGPSAALLLCGWALAIVALALFVTARLDSASAGSLAAMLPGGRLVYPSGYANANAAMWLMAFWPALLMARSERVAWALRGLLAGGAVLLAGVALLSQSRGSLYSTPVMLVLVFLLLPGRLRTFALLVPVAGGIALTSPSVLHVGNDLAAGAVRPGALHHALAVTLLAAGAVAVVVAAAAAVESRRSFSAASSRRVHHGLLALALAALLALVGGLLAVGHPIGRITHAWDTFKSPSGYAANGSGDRLLSGLGSSRYDFYRVALDEFAAHPVIGIGADNFEQQYLAHARGYETPHYPHSVELRTLVQTGLIGALLAVVGLGAALLAAMRACRRRGAGEDPLAAAVAAAALAGFGYWVVHGSFDWFWEFAGLGAPAFALLGLSCSLAPRAAPGGARSPSPGGPGAGRVPRRLALALGALVALACAASLTAPWLSQLELQSAVGVWTKDPQTAYAGLDRAARLNPLSDEPYVVSGSIALRLGDTARARRAFAAALSRVPGDAYATLELGAIASAGGQRAQALRLLRRAVRLEPREALAQEALKEVLEHRRLSVVELNRMILLKAQQLA